ncbi:OGG1 [Candida theae]|uniref:N-glycosylase/DNA lyase n=1 Tax=Candida theae TaxID=1198502 RepID=A0AAD5G0T7_9ASCO|nr:OGG1 [Candida theae]KAI5967594.1 OGG1 [Candida theae]
MTLVWNKLALKETEVSLAKVLRCGQTFRWKSINNVWSFAISDRIVLLKQDQDHIYYSQVLAKSEVGRVKGDVSQATLGFIQDYFALDVKLTDLYQEWKLNHKPYITTKVKQQQSPFDLFSGIRTLRQDPWECLISFICSSNNNVKRISKMCDNLCIQFGNYINDYEGIPFYSFPTPQQLSSDPSVESKLRELGFGYRAKYIYQTACKFTDDDTYPHINLAHLMQLRQCSYEEAHEFLLQLTGVGPKVADCICLMSLDKSNVVPIDTHVYQIAVRDFKYRGGGKREMKTLSKAMHDDIRRFFQGIFGDYAGWAQSVLFAADLTDLNNGVNIVETKKEKEVSGKESKVKIKTEEEIKISSAGSKRTKTIKLESNNKRVKTIKADLTTVVKS